MKATVSKMGYKPYTITINLKLDAANRMINDYVVIKEVDNELRIREGTILDNKTYKLTNKSTTTYTSLNAPKFIGHHDLILEDGYFIIEGTN
jgi:hypothetical protein